MESRKKLLDRTSIQLRLSLSLAAVIVCCAVVSAAIAYNAAKEEINELQDETLRQVAVIAAQQPEPAGSFRTTDRKRRVEDASLVIRVLPSKSPTENRSAEETVLNALPLGFSTTDVAGVPYRVFGIALNGSARLLVAQETELRDETAKESALRTLVPMMLLAPALAFLAVFLVRRSFIPVSRLARELDRRNDNDFSVLDEHKVPAEMRPFTLALNRLFARTAQTLAAQHRFIADAAHELRTPLTALSLQAERLAAYPLGNDAKQRLDALRQGIRRGQRLVEQLLTLARLQSKADETRLPLSVDDLFRRVIEEMLPLAEAKNIDLGMEVDRRCVLRTNEFELGILLRNLVDNAVRHSPVGARVDLRAIEDDASLSLSVSDFGPGIAEQDREQAFAPFHRLPGSPGGGAGLGLAIVHTIAKHLSATIRLSYTDEQAQRGLTLQLRFSKETTGADSPRQV